MKLPEETIKQGVALGAVTLVAIPLAWKPLSDVDLGWHLASGLLLQAGYPLWGEDSLGSTGHAWWNYSWLFQIVIASIFRLGGFGALCVLQGALILASVFFFFGHALGQRSDADNSNPYTSATPAVCAIALLPFLAPMWHLRPQLISISLFILMLSPNVRFIPRLVLTVLWANIHVFWIFSPLIFGAKLIDEPQRWRFFLGGATVLFLCGFLTPFGVETYLGLFRYAFVHQTAYALIKEFQPFSTTMGLLFWYGLLLTGVMLWRLVKTRRKIPRDSMVLSVLFLCAAAAQIKYVPYAAIAALPVILSTGVNRGKSGANRRSPFFALSFVAVVGFCSCLVLYLESPTPYVDEWRVETLRVAGDLSRVLCRKGIPGTLDPLGEHRDFALDRTNVLTDFNDGGWFALGVTLACPQVNRPRTTIDGRTLVIGQQRISEYRDFVSLKDGWEHIYAAWGVSAVALPYTMPLAQSLHKDREQFGLTIIQSHPNWVVMIHEAKLDDAELMIQNSSH